MWKCEEYDVVALEGLGRGLAKDLTRKRRELWLVLAEARTRVATRRQRADLDPGVTEQQAQQLTTGVPTRPGDRDPHTHDSPSDTVGG
jgi:hypothetical protein